MFGRSRNFGGLDATNELIESTNKFKKSYSNLRFASAGPTSTLMTIANEKTNMRSSRLKPGNVLPAVVELTR